MKIIKQLILAGAFFGLTSINALAAEAPIAKLFRFDNCWTQSGDALSSDDQRPVIIFVHGQNIAGDSGSASCNTDSASLNLIKPMALAASNSSNYAGVFGFNYDFTKGISDLGEKFSELVTPLTKNYNVHIVAHSMGGLVARWALEHGGLDSIKVKHLVTIATPHTGLPVSKELQALLPLGQLIAIMNPQMAPLVGYLNSLPQLISGSVALTELNTKKKNVSTKYHVIQGQISEPCANIPVSELLTSLLYKPSKTQNDGVIPTLSKGVLIKILPCNSVEVVVHDKVNHMDFLGTEFVDKNLIPYLAKLTN